MSVHPSLRATGEMKRHRSVLTRLERLKTLLARGAWREDRSAFRLPKVKHLKVTVKKEKAAAAPAAAAGPVQETPRAAPATPKAGGPQKPETAKPRKGS